MATFGVDGIVSGLDTTSLIASLMKAEAMPQDALKTSVTTTQNVITAYQNVNARFASVQTAADLLGKAETWSAVAATSSDASVSATADTTATSGAFSFRVTSTAAGQISVSKAVALTDASE